MLALLVTAPFFIALIPLYCIGYKVGLRQGIAETVERHKTYAGPLKVRESMLNNLLKMRLILQQARRKHSIPDASTVENFLSNTNSIVRRANREQFEQFEERYND